VALASVVGGGAPVVAVSPGVWVSGYWWEVEQLHADRCSPSDSPGKEGGGGQEHHQRKTSSVVCGIVVR
jgi:hypothetical protein